MKCLSTMLVLVFAVALAAGAAPPPVTSLAYHPDGKFLAAGTHGEFALITVATGDITAVIGGQTNRVTALAFNPGGDRLAVASGEPGKSGVIRLYEMKDGVAKLVETRSPAHADIIYALTFSPDGKLLVSAGYDRIIKLWNAATNAEPRQLSDHSDAIYGLSFHPDGKLLASAAADRAVKVWDIESGKRLYTLSDPTDWVYTVSWSPDGKHLAAAGIDRNIRVWAAGADGGKLVHAVFAHTQPVTRLAYAKDGKTLYSIGQGPTVKGWDTATMKEKVVFPPQTETMLCLALAPDQKQIAIGYFDGKLKLLDASMGNPVAVPLPAKAKPPMSRKQTPDAGVRGQTVRVAIEGEHLSDVSEVAIDRPGVQARIIAEGRTATRLDVDLTISADASAGVVNLVLKAPAGTSASTPFTIDRYPVILEAGPGDSPRIGMKVKLPATLVGSLAKAGDADYFRFTVDEDEEVALQAITVGSKLEPILELNDANGKLLAESATGLLGYRFKRAGTYALGIRDKEFRGGGDFTYRISAGPFPLLMGITPLSARRGVETALNLHGVHLGAERRVRITPAADAMPGSKAAVPLPILNEKVVGEASVFVGEYPESAVVDGRATLAVPGAATGVISGPGIIQVVDFHALKGQRLVVEVSARRLGSPLDSTIEITDQREQPVMRATLRGVARAYSTFRDHDSAMPGIRLETWNELAIDDYLYADGELMRIKQMPKGPDDDCLFYQVSGQRTGFLDTTPAHHALGSTIYKVELHPPGTAFPPNGLPSYQLAYRNDDGGPDFGKDSRLFFDPPTDGVYRVRIRDARGQGGELFAYRLTVRPPHPDFSISFNPIAPSVWKGGSVPITVTATRLDGYDGPIAVKLEGLPAGFDAPATSIETGQTTTTFPLYAPPQAATSPTIKLTARSQVPGKQIVHEAMGGALTLVEPGDIVTTTSVTEVTFKPGESTKLLVSVERRNGFAGRIPLDVRGLPHGVRVLNIGLNGILVTERDTKREVVLYAEPWVQPMERPIIVLATHEGKKTEHGARPVMLKVVK